MNHYNTLSLPLDADPEEIRAAYFAAVKSSHPDAVRESGHTQAFFQVQQAYNVLSSPERRTAYDADLNIGTEKQKPVHLDVQYSRSSVQLLEEPQLLYAWVEIRAAADDSGVQRRPTHICLVIDRSTSMAGERIEQIRRSIISALPFFSPQDRLSLVTFNDRPEILMLPTLQPQPHQVESRLRSLHTGGGTEIYQGLNTGYSLLAQDGEAIRQLILLTDGKTYGDENACMQLAARAAEEGVRFSGLGFGSEWNDQFLDRLAATTGGQAMFAASMNDLQKLLTAQLQDSTSAYASQVVLNFNLAPGVEIKEAFRVQPDETPLPCDSQLLLGELPMSRPLQLLLELVLPPVTQADSSYKIGEATINLQVPTRHIHRQRVQFEMCRPVGRSVGTGETPGILRRAVLRFNLYRMQERARQQVKEGRYEQATQQLLFLAAQFEREGDKELARTALLEAEHIRNTQAFSGLGEKRLKYATRALIGVDRTETE